MNKKTTAAHALLLFVLMLTTPASAGDTVRVLTPTNDTCRAYTNAMIGGDKSTVPALAGWYLGFLSGVAQGTGIDFLRNASAEELSQRLYNDCQRQPDKPLSLAAEEIANKLVGGQKP